MSLELNIRIVTTEDGDLGPMELAVIAALSGTYPDALDKGGKLTQGTTPVTASTPAEVKPVAEVHTEAELAEAKAEAPKPARKAPVKRTAPAPKQSTGPAVLEEDPTDDKMDADAREAHEAAEASQADPTDTDPTDEADPTDEVKGSPVTYDDVLARATALAAKSKQPEIKKVLSSIGGFAKVRELADADESVLAAFMSGLKDL